MADRTSKGLDDLFKDSSVTEPPVESPSNDEPPQAPVEETVEPTEDEPVETQPDVSVKLNPDFPVHPEGGDVVVSVANHPNFTVTKEPQDVPFEFANLLLTSPAVIRADAD